MHHVYKEKCAKRKRDELKAAIYAVTLEKEGLGKKEALAVARAAYGLEDLEERRSEPQMSESWRRGMMREIAEGHPGAEGGKSEAQAMREYRRKRRDEDGRPEKA